MADALRRASRHLDKLSERLDPDVPCLLDDQRRLYTPREAGTRMHLINDDPAPASAAQAQGVPVAFADTSDRQVNARVVHSGGRMAITRARRGLEGAEAFLKLRAILANGDSSQYWPCHLRREHGRIHHALPPNPRPCRLISSP